MAVRKLVVYTLAQAVNEQKVENLIPVPFKELVFGGLVAVATYLAGRRLPEEVSDALYIIAGGSLARGFLGLVKQMTSRPQVVVSAPSVIETA